VRRVSGAEGTAAWLWLLMKSWVFCVMSMVKCDHNPELGRPHMMECTMSYQEDICIAFDVAPVPLTLEDLTDPTSPGIVVCCADKEFDRIKFDMIEFDSGRRDFRCKYHRNGHYMHEDFVDRV
jgi:hypothetical protein